MSRCSPALQAYLEQLSREMPADARWLYVRPAGAWAAVTNGHAIVGVLGAAPTIDLAAPGLALDDVRRRPSPGALAKVLRKPRRGRRYMVTTTALMRFADDTGALLTAWDGERVRIGLVGKTRLQPRYVRDFAARAAEAAGDSSVVVCVHADPEEPVLFAGSCWRALIMPVAVHSDDRIKGTPPRLRLSAAAKVRQ